MRLLICQTPRLTYVQAVELLNRETAGWDCQMALFPEFALEHPPQCTEQGELSFNNVGLLAMANFAKRRGIYIVLGSVEERSLDSRAYDTCLVLNPQGEIALKYRKMSPVGNKHAGTEPGLFETEEGLVGVLMGAEVEEEVRWAPLLARQPCLVLNPTRAPMQMDPVLARCHPELQVVAWHRSFVDIQRAVESRTRHAGVAFARADAPLQAGGAGTSMLVEPHRSVPTSSWNAAFLAVDTTLPGELRSHRMPGWRQLSVEERISAARRDKAMLMDEEAELGPRYVVWTLQMPERAARILSGHGLVRTVEELRVEALASIDDVKQRRSYLVPVQSRAGQLLYAVATNKGSLTLWDATNKQEVASLALAQGTITAMGTGQNPHHFLVAGRTYQDLTFRLFDESSPVYSTAIPCGNLPWDAWPKVSCGGGGEESGIPEEPATGSRVDSAMSSVSRRSGMNSSSAPIFGSAPCLPLRKPFVRAIFPLEQPNMVLAVVEAGPGGYYAPIGLLVDMQRGTAEAIDLYGSGVLPRWRPAGAAELEDDQGLDGGDDGEGEGGTQDASRGTGVAECLVGIALVEQRFQDRTARSGSLRQCTASEERPGSAESAVVCLYQTNRMVVLTMSDFQKHEQMLLEEAATRRQREDEPVSIAVLPSSSNGCFHILVSYKSLYMRWWQVSLTGCRQVAMSQVYKYRVLHLAIMELPSTAASMRPQVGVEPSSHGASKRGHGTGVDPTSRGASTGRSSLSLAARASPRQQGSQAVGLGRRGSSRGRGGLDGKANVVAFQDQALARCIAKPSSSSSTRGTVAGSSTVPDSSKQAAAAAAAAAATSEPALGSSGSLLIVGVDSEGHMPLFVGSMGKISKVYTCSLDGGIGGGPTQAGASPMGSTPAAPAKSWGRDAASVGEEQGGGEGGGFRRLSLQSQSQRPDQWVCQVWCLEKSLACVLTCGDIRHIEITLEDEAIALRDLAGTLLEAT
mmetsp:Transcript_117448/g.374282  ORF Transcript_117448/g.374282 Transcript_117448/m.374282 type:complete len:972 (+) Transcript_117448:84-2999(+)